MALICMLEEEKESVKCVFEYMVANRLELILASVAGLGQLGVHSHVQTCLLPLGWDNIVTPEH